MEAVITDKMTADRWTLRIRTSLRLCRIISIDMGSCVAQYLNAVPVLSCASPVAGPRAWKEGVESGRSLIGIPLSSVLIATIARYLSTARVA